KKVGAQDEAERRGRLREMVRWVAAAQFQRGEKEYEQFLKLKFPSGLNFDKRKPKREPDSLHRALI
ncbi:MAG: hypothetical protein GWP08_21520, partial [Nitrospiraceae bacterium]|nr:hypothetical protein [Nitrospiraceae bacterium]